MICYHLTDKDMRTRGGLFQWEFGKWKRERGVLEDCAPATLNAYEYSLLAVLHDPMYANYLATEGARMFRCKTRGRVTRDGQMKMGAPEMRLVEEIEIPTITAEQRIRYAILCAAEVVPMDNEWGGNWWAWAVNWWTGLDRTPEAATGLALAAREAARAAARTTEWAAAQAAREAARAAARMAEWAAWAAWAAAQAAAWAAERAELAVHDAVGVASELNLLALAKIAVNNERDDVGRIKYKEKDYAHI